MDLVRRADSSGFSVVTGPDHVGSRLAAVLPMLSVAAAVSPRIRVSPMVLANDFRHPVVLAKDTATIDILSEGRFELGIGTGWIKAQYQAAGVRYEPARIRVDQFEELITVIKGCWSGEPFSFARDHYHVKDVTCPRPLQQPHPPILIAGAGPRMLKIAGQEADIVSIAPATPAVQRSRDSPMTSSRRVTMSPVKSTGFVKERDPDSAVSSSVSSPTMSP